MLRPTPPPIPPHPVRATRCLLALVLGGCWANHARLDAAPATDGPPPAPDVTVPTAARRDPVGAVEMSDGALPDAMADSARDLAVHPDAGADLAPDAAVPPDLAAPPPDARAIMPDVAPPPPDVAPPVPDVAPPASDLPSLMPDVAPPPDLPPPPPDLPPPAPDLPPPPPDLMPSTGCPSGRGPAMVKADLATKPFCIDATEVTNAQYAAFLASVGNDTGGQPSACGWNGSYVPVVSDGASWPPAAGTDDKPVVNVDWCDARAFCKWAGKRLCGKIGGGSLTGVSAATSPTGSQWDHACSRNGQRTYPYGQTFVSSACNVDATVEGASSIASVGSYPGCQGGYAGLLDMSGNVEEWVDACDKNTGGSDLCASAGASAYLGGLTPAEITCPDSLYGTPRNTAYVMLGFRCCAELP